MTKNKSALTNCKACNEEISKKAKKCPKCGHDQRNFFGRHKFLTTILVALALTVANGVLSSDPEIEYVPYNYGDTVRVENTKPNTDFSLPKGVLFSVDKQTLVTKSELITANPFNSPTNDVAVLEITIKNDSEKPFDFNLLGFTYVTENDIYLSTTFGSMYALPENFASLHSFSAGDLMPGNTVKGIIDIEIPDGDLIKTLVFDYFGTEFTIDLTN